MSSAKKILIIDGELVVREALQIILGDSYMVLQARSAREGLTMLSEDVGLVFLDYMLPLANGLDVLKQIKKMCPAVPVIFITAYLPPFLEHSHYFAFIDHKVHKSFVVNLSNALPYLLQTQSP